MDVARTAHVRCLAYLDGFQRRRGEPASFDIVVPPGGESADDLAARIGLPVDKIEGVFLNYRVAGMNSTIRPGDRVAFVPHGTPASHPSFFGAFVTRE